MSGFFCALENSTILVGSTNDKQMIEDKVEALIILHKVQDQLAFIPVEGRGQDFDWKAIVITIIEKKMIELSASIDPDA